MNQEATFKLASGEEIHIHLDEVQTVEGYRLRITSARGVLVIRPAASNSILLTTAKAMMEEEAILQEQSRERLKSLLEKGKPTPAMVAMLGSIAKQPDPLHGIPAKRHGSARATLRALVDCELVVGALDAYTLTTAGREALQKANFRL